MRLIISNSLFYTVHFARTSLDPERRTFHCYVHEGKCTQHPCNGPAMHGTTRCSHLDQFVKAKGRKIAFTRAISSLPATTRALLWREYLKQSPPPPARPTARPTERGQEVTPNAGAMGAVRESGAA
jgi:hypothetical protein